MFFFVVWGFLLWLGVTVVVRIAGQFFFNADITLVLLAFGVTVPLIAVATYPIYSWRNVEPSQRLIAAMYAVLPGMLLDVFVVLFFPYVFPNLLPERVALYSAWLFWGYSLALLTGFVPKLSATPKQIPFKQQ